MVFPVDIDPLKPYVTVYDVFVEDSLVICFVSLSTPVNVCGFI
jgi:hypothetical protein